MSDVVAELATRVKLSDPKPTRCAACFTSADADLRFVNYDAAIDRGTVVDEGSMAVLESIDELHLCEGCVRAGAEALGLKPELHARQLREIRRQQLAIDHWRDYAKRLEATLKDRPEAAPRGRRGR